MPHPEKSAYDTIIIGAGIGGLVCGCYLAKAGMKVLIAEQHSKPGGYCTSFKRQGFTFDAAAHSFGGYRRGGTVRKVFDELGVSGRVRIKRYDPSDVIITPECEVSFRSELDRTIRSFQAAFPAESNSIEHFFISLSQPEPGSLAGMRKLTFKTLLDTCFNNEKLKALLSFPLFGNGGLPPSLMSAFAGSKIFAEFLLDGGYYPEGNMQSLPDTLSSIFADLGGTLLLSCPATRIQIKDKRVKGVILRRSDVVKTTCVVSNCDAIQTFSQLLGKTHINESVARSLHDMTPSLSMFVLYLGMDGYVQKRLTPGTNIWFLPHHSIEDMYKSAKSRNAGNLAEYMARLSPDGKTLLAFTNAAFKTKTYWRDVKEKLQDSFIEKIEHSIFPGLSKHILYKDAATPGTLQRYTLNHRGAAYGWACTPEQFADPEFRKPSFIEGLYLTGHWTTYAQGIPGVTYLGYDTAKLVLKKLTRVFCS
jgi:phytoene dehydrogenase-like protein